MPALPNDRRTYVYAVTCLANGKEYIGITNQESARARWRGHRSCAKLGSNLPLHGAIRKYGVENFVVVAIATCQTREDGCAVERHLIAERCTRIPYGYNITPGGDNGGTREQTAEERAKTGEFFRQYWSDPERRRQNAERYRGTRMSLETREKMSVAQKERHRLNGGMLPHVKAAIIAANTGKKHSEETRKKISAIQTGRKLTPEWKAKVGAAFRGKKLTDEHKRKVSAAQKWRHLGPIWLANITARNKQNIGKKFSDEVRKRMSAAVRASMTPERRAKLSAASKGRVHSPETRAKISAARLRTVAAKRAKGSS